MRSRFTPIALLQRLNEMIEENKTSLPFFFKAWQNEPKVSLHDETAIQSVLKVPLTPSHEGKVFRCAVGGTERSFLIVQVSPNVHLPEMVGEDGSTGPYRVVTAREV